MQSLLLPNSYGINPEDEAEIPTARWTPDGWLILMRDGSWRPDFIPQDNIWTPDGTLRKFDEVKWGLFDPKTGQRLLTPIRGGSVGPAYTLQSTTPFAMTTGAKTHTMAIAPAGHGLALTEWAMSFDGITSSAVPALVEVVNSTQGGAGTAGVSTVITQTRGKATSGSAPTMGGNYTAEPTTLVSLRRYYVPQFMGTFVYQAPLGREIECDSSGGTIKALGVRINVTANVNVVGYLEVEANG